MTSGDNYLDTRRGAFGPESGMFSPMASLVVIVLLWPWKGSTAMPTVVVLPATISALV